MEIQAGQLIQYLIQAIIVLLLILLMRMLRNGGLKNPGTKQPGQAAVCIARGEKIVKLETEQTNFEKDIGEIKDDIKDIKKAVVIK